MQILILYKNRIYYILLFFVTLIFLASCNSSKLPITEFTSEYPLTDINGRYWSGVTASNRGNLAYTFNKRQFEDWIYTVEAIDLRFNGKDSLFVDFYDPENQLVKSIAYRGEKKGLYFEIYFSKKLIPIPAAYFYQRDRIRIGINKEKKLIVHNWHDSFVWLLVIVGGSNEDYSDSMPKQDEWAYSYRGIRSFRVGDYWGCLNSRGDTIIAPEYDMLFPFDVNHNVYVKKDNKWALADTLGNFKTPFAYSKIHAPDSDNTSLYQVSLKKSPNEWKYGYIDKDGDQWLDCIYDDISNARGNFKILKQGKLYGLATYDDGIVIPVKFKKGAFGRNFESEIKTVDGNIFPDKVLLVKYKGKKYYLDMNGNMYRQVQRFLSFPRIDISSKQNIYEIDADID